MSSTRLEALLQISDTIAGVRDLKELIHTLTKPLKQAVDFEYVAVLLHEPETDVMRLYVIETAAESQLPPGTLPRGETPSGLCLETQQPVVIDVESETRFPTITGSLRRNGIKTSCYLPLSTPLRRLGAITFGSHSATRFEDDIPFLWRVANQVAAAIDNAL